MNIKLYLDFMMATRLTCSIKLVHEKSFVQIESTVTKHTCKQCSNLCLDFDYKARQMCAVVLY